MSSRAPLPLARCSSPFLLAVVGLTLALVLSGCLGVEQTVTMPSAPYPGPSPQSAESDAEPSAYPAPEDEDEDAGMATEAYPGQASSGAIELPVELPVGAAFALTGSGSSFGRKGEAALALAEATLAEDFAEILRVPPIEVRDTETSPERALEIVQALHEEGVRIVIGPQTSANTAAVKDFADANGMILISPSSVARALAIPDDNVFRMTPDDALQAEAMSRMLVEDGLSTVFVVHRDDLWGEDLAGLVAELLAPQGSIALDVRGYDSTAPDPDALLAGLAEDVAAAVAEEGAEAVGVYLLSFGEGADVLAAAGAHEGLDAVRWYGSSAVAQSSTYLQDPAVIAFAETVGYPSPVFGLDPDTRARWEPVREELLAATGEEADIYALATYDALALVFQAVLDLQTRGGAEDLAEGLRAQIPATAAGMVGVTGPLTMNEAGDRAGGTMDFWAIQTGEEGAAWRRVAVYDAEAGTLTRSDEQP